MLCCRTTSLTAGGIGVFTPTSALSLIFAARSAGREMGRLRCRRQMPLKSSQASATSVPPLDHVSVRRRAKLFIFLLNCTFTAFRSSVMLSHDFAHGRRYRRFYADFCAVAYFRRPLGGLRNGATPLSSPKCRPSPPKPRRQAFRRLITSPYDGERNYFIFLLNCTFTAFRPVADFYLIFLSVIP